MAKIINRAYEVDCAGEVVQEFLLLLPYQDFSSLGLLNAREMIVITTWYLWWVSCKLVYGGVVQDAFPITTNYVIASYPKGTMRREGWICSPWVLSNLTLMLLLIKTCLGV